MTEQEQRICIAETCGFQRWFGGIDVILCKPRDNRQRQYWLYSGSVIVDRPVDSMREVPDYLHDLNAMHAAEKIEALSSNASTYDYWLNRMTNGYAWHATAAQRAEAFCRVMWPERWKH